MNSSFNSPSFSGFDGFDMAKDVNNGFANDKSLNDDVVNNEFVNSTAVHNEIVDNNNGDSLKNKFLNKIFPIGGNARSDSVNTENTVSNITHNSHGTGIVMDDSFVSVEGPIDPNDISANESEDISETEDFRFSRPIEEENLYELHCPRIGSPFDRSLINEVKNTGPQLHLRITCSRECDTEWRSQPLVGNFKGLGKLFVTTSITFSDIPFSKFERFAKFLNLKSISDTLFYQLRCDVLCTVVVKKWKQQRKRMLQPLKQQEKVVLVGDGRCDSPGYSAKYCTYTFMEANTSNVVDTMVVPVTEVSNSNAMEKEGFKRLVFSFCLVLHINIFFRYRRSHHQRS